MDVFESPSYYWTITVIMITITTIIGAPIYIINNFRSKLKRAKHMKRRKDVKNE